jgi:acyltransferase
LGVNRLKEIEVVKGITIFLVVLGHSGLSDGILSEILSDFRMPLFFLISGYLFSTSKYLNDTKRLINVKSMTLLIPYVSFAMIGAGLYYFSSIKNNLDTDWLRPFVGLSYGNGNWITYNIAIWFLVCLFCAFILFQTILKYTQTYSTIVQSSIFVFFGIVGFLISKFIWLPLSIDIALVVALFMYIGLWLKENQILRNQKLMLIITLVSVVLFALTLIFNDFVDINNRTFGNILWFYVGGLSGSFIILTLAKYVLAKVKILYTIFSYLGKESLIILGIHSSLAMYAITMVDNKLSFINISSMPLLTAAIAIGISLVIGLIIDRIPILSLLFKGKIIKKKPIIKTTEKAV